MLNDEPLANPWHLFPRAAGQVSVGMSSWLFGGVDMDDLDALEFLCFPTGWFLSASSGSLLKSIGSQVQGTSHLQELQPGFLLA